MKRIQLHKPSCCEIIRNWGTAALIVGALFTPPMAQAGDVNAAIKMLAVNEAFIMEASTCRMLLPIGKTSAAPTCNNAIALLKKGRDLMAEADLSKGDFAKLIEVVPDAIEMMQATTTEVTMFTAVMEAYNQ